MKDKGYIDTSQCPETFHVLGFTDEGRPALFHIDDSECELSEYDLRIMKEAA